jgi:phosphoglycerate dehydrogenase-like enzyme
LEDRAMSAAGRCGSLDAVVARAWADPHARAFLASQPIANALVLAALNAAVMHLAIGVNPTVSAWGTGGLVFEAATAGISSMWGAVTPMMILSQRQLNASPPEIASGGRRPLGVGRAFAIGAACGVVGAIGAACVAAAAILGTHLTALPRDVAVGLKAGMSFLIAAPAGFVAAACVLGSGGRTR